MIVKCACCFGLARFYTGPASEARCPDCGAHCFMVAPVRLSEPDAFRWLLDRPAAAVRADEPKPAEAVPVSRVRLDRIVALAEDARDALRGLTGSTAEDCGRTADAAADLTQILVLCGAEGEREPCHGQDCAECNVGGCPGDPSREPDADDTAKDRR